MAASPSLRSLRKATGDKYDITLRYYVQQCSAIFGGIFNTGLNFPGPR